MRLPVDKLLHLGAGALLAGAGTFISPLAGATLCAAGAVGREVYNQHSGGTFDLYDLAATLLGGAVVLLPWALAP